MTAGEPQRRRCARCGRLLEVSALNVEATIHHGARSAVCYDRKACVRARRKSARKSK